MPEVISFSTYHIILEGSFISNSNVTCLVYVFLAFYFPRKYHTFHISYKDHYAISGPSVTYIHRVNKTKIHMWGYYTCVKWI